MSTCIHKTTGSTRFRMIFLLMNPLHVKCRLIFVPSCKLLSGYPSLGSFLWCLSTWQLHIRMYCAWNGEITFTSLTDIRNLIQAKLRHDSPESLGKWTEPTAGKRGSACARGATSLTGRSILRAKAHKFTLHEALIAESCGSNVEFLIYSLWPPPPKVPDSGKLRGHRHWEKCVSVFLGKETHQHFFVYSRRKSEINNKTEQE